jgi:hypothetical protein
MNRTVFPPRSSVFCARLAFQNCSVGYRIGVRPPDLTAKQPLKPRLAAQHSLLLIIDVKDIELTLASGESPDLQQPPQDGCGKRIEEKHYARARWERKLRGIAAEDPHRCTRLFCGAPLSQIPASNMSERRVQLDSNDGAEWVRGGQKHGTAHAGAQIDKRVRVDGRYGPATTPADDYASKH